MVDETSAATPELRTIRGRTTTPQIGNRHRTGAAATAPAVGIGRAQAALAAVSGPLPGLDLRRLAARQALPLAVVALLIWAGWDRLTGIDLRRIAAILGEVGPVQWLTGALFTGVSFWAVGRYDAVVHRLTGTDFGAAESVETGAAAIAIGQTVGMGTLTAAFVRWRLLPALGLAGAMRISVIVSLSFLAAWAVLAAALLLVVPLPVPRAAGIVPVGAAAVIALALTAAALSLIRPRFLPVRLSRALPSLRAMTTVLGLAALDTLAAGTVLWILLPETAELAAATVLCAYLLALGAGLVLTTPGGLGPFEAALIALLPAVEPEPLLAAIVAYRALYYALPAFIGGLVLIRGPRRNRRARATAVPAVSGLPTAPTLPFLLDAVIDRAPRAEAGLLRLGRLSLANDRAGRPMAMVARTGQSLVMLSDPLRQGADAREVLSLLSHAARRSFAAPLLYKSGARLAAAARARGWAVLVIAREAWLDPRGFTTDGRNRARLRRKLRKARSAGVTVTACPPGAARTLPLQAMAGIAADWAAAHGGERGFSMGTWAPDTLDWAHVFLAHDAGGVLLGFITLHGNANEHALDLMRARDTGPDGLMYLLVASAIEAAGRAGVRRFSFAAVPEPADDDAPAPLAALRRLVERASGAGGLRQFKSAFDPHWEKLYLAAPNRWALVAGALDVTREITRGACPPVQ